MSHGLTRAQRDLVSLTALAMLREGPMHPYEIQRLIRERHKEFVTGLPRSLYHAMERLHRVGWIEPVETTREGRRPERTVYEITEDGATELHWWLGRLLSTPDHDQQLFYAALSFLPLLSGTTAAHALSMRAAALHGEIARVRASLQALEGKLPRVVLLEEEYLCIAREAELRWVRDLIAAIETGEVCWDRDALAQERQRQHG